MTHPDSDKQRECEWEGGKSRLEMGDGRWEMGTDVVDKSVCGSPCPFFSDDKSGSDNRIAPSSPNLSSGARVDRARGPLLVPSRPARPQFHDRGRFLVPEGSRPAPLCLG